MPLPFKSDIDLKDIVEGTDDLIVRMNNRGRIVYINPAVLKTFGLPPEAFLEKRALSFIRQKDIADTRRLVARLLAARAEGATMQNRIVDEAGRVCHMMWTLNFSYAGGKLESINAVGRDITEQMAMEQALRSNQEMWNKLFMASPTWILLASLESGNFLDCNDTFCQDSGYAKEEVIGRNTKELGLWSGTEERDRILNMIKTRRRIDKHPLKMRLRGGAMRDFLWSCIIVEVQGRECLLSVLVDVSDLKKAQEQLAGANEELKSRSRELAEMNSALKVLLRQREEDKKDLESRMWHNLKKMIQPHIHNLRKSGLNPTQLAHLDVVDNRLGEIASNLGRSLGHTAHDLTPRELEVAGHVLEGKSNKSIAEILNISIYSVHSHRQAIRKKLGLLGTRENLHSHLAGLLKQPDRQVETAVR